MSAFAIPLQPKPSAVDVLKRIPSEAFKKVPKGKIPTGIPNSTLSYVEAAAAAEVLRELYGADFDANKYIQQINQELKRFRPVQENYTQYVPITSEREKVIGEINAEDVPQGTIFDLTVSGRYFFSNSEDYQNDSVVLQKWNDVLGYFVPPYTETIKTPYFTDDGKEVIYEVLTYYETVTEKWGYRKTLLGRTRTYVEDGITWYQIFSYGGYSINDSLVPVPSDIKIPTLQVEFVTEFLPVQRSRTVWNPVYPQVIPIPVQPPLDTEIDTRIEIPLDTDITTEIDTPLDSDVPLVKEVTITVDPPLVADPPPVLINKPTKVIPVEIIPQFDLEIPLNEPLIDLPVDMAIPPPPIPLEPVTTPVPPEFSTADSSIPISDPFVPPTEIDVTSRSIPTEEQSPTQKKAREESIDSFEQVNFANPLVSGIPIPVTGVNTNSCQTSSNPCQSRLDTGISGNGKRLDEQTLQLDRLLNGVGATGQILDITILNRIDTKLGAQVPGGIGGKLSGLSRRMKLPEIINVLAFMATLHNAAMLSKNLAVTMGDIATLGLQVVGLKDEDGTPHNVNDIIGDTVNNMMKNLLGEEVWTDTKDTWKSANRMYQTAANIVYSVGSMVDSARSIGEWTGENLGKIGNALKSAGVVASSAYNWMPEQINAATGRIRSLQKMRDGINAVDSSVSAFGSVVSEVKSIQDEVGEMRTKKEDFEKDLEKLAPKGAKDNEKVKEREDQEELDNKAPEYSRDDLQRAD